MNKATHIAYLKGREEFQFQCHPEIFCDGEVDIIKRHGNWFQALTEGLLVAFTPEQERFVQVAHMELPPASPHEKAWWRYLKRKEIEEEYGEAMHTLHHLNDDTFHNREMAKKVRSTMASENSKIHNSKG